MEHSFSTSTPLLVQCVPPGTLEDIVSRLIDKKLVEASIERAKLAPEYRLYTLKNAAALLGVPISTLKEWNRAGIINYRKIGSRFYYTGKDIEDVMNKILKK